MEGEGGNPSDSLVLDRLVRGPPEGGGATRLSFLQPQQCLPMILSSIEHMRRFLCYQVLLQCVLWNSIMFPSTLLSYVICVHWSDC